MAESGPPFLPFFIGAIGVLTGFNAAIYQGWRFDASDEPVAISRSPARHSMVAAAITSAPSEFDLATATRRWLADQEAAYLELIEIAESEEARRTLGVLLEAARAQSALGFEFAGKAAP